MKREDELANNLLERIAGTHSSLARVAQRLRQGAAALQVWAGRSASGSVVVPRVAALSLVAALFLLCWAWQRAAAACLVREPWACA